MKAAPIMTAAILTALCFPALAQEPAPPPPPSTAPAPPVPDGPRKARSQSFTTRVITTDGGHAGGRIGPPGMWWKNPELTQKLNITPDQQKRMDDIFQQSRLQLIDLKANVEKQDVLLEPMLDANPPDTNKILAQIDKAAQARAELEKANARMLLGIRNVLTPDQWTKLQAEERENHRFIIRGGPGGPDGPGGMGFFGVQPKGPGGPGPHFHTQSPDLDGPPL